MKYTSRHALKPTVFGFVRGLRSRSLSILMASTLAGGLALTMSCGGGGGGGSSETPTQNQPSTPPLLELVVSPDGDAGSDGTSSAPTTLEGAQAIIRNTARTRPGALRVVLRGGAYVRTGTFSLGAVDSGAIYSMRNWGSRADAIQYNLIRNNGGPLGDQIYGVYLDMGASGITVEGNIFYKAGPNMALVHNGGRDVTMQYNIFYGHWYGTFTSNSGIIYITQGGGGDLLDKLVHFNCQTPPWSTAYPEVAAIPNDWAQIQGSHWLQPEGSVFYGNLQWGGNLPPVHSSSSIEEGNYDPSPQNSPLHWFTQNAENINGGKDPEFVNPEGSNPGDYRLQPTSPMFSIPGFPGIDASKIGIQH